MIQFYTVDELFHKQDIDEDFIASFNKLTISSQSIVKAKNCYLKDWIESNEIEELASFVVDNLDKVDGKSQEVETETKLKSKGEFNSENTENFKTQNYNELSFTSQLLADNESIKVENSESSSKDGVETKLDNSQILDKLDREYNSLNFNQEILHINNLYLVLLDKKAKNCPIHKKKLVKKKILMKVDGENKKITLNTCQFCKRFYFFNKGEDLNKLRKTNIPYKIIHLEDID